MGTSEQKVSTNANCEIAPTMNSNITLNLIESLDCFFNFFIW